MASPSAGTVSYEASCIPETIKVVTSFMKRNSIPSGEVPATVKDIHAALLEIAGQAGVFEDSLVQLEASASRYLGKPSAEEATVEEYLPSLRLAAFDTFGFRAPQLPAPPAAPYAPAALAPPAPATPEPVAARPAVAPQEEPAPALRAPPRKRVRPSRAKPKPAAEQPSLFAREDVPQPAQAATPVVAASAAVAEPETASRKETRNERRRRTRPSRAKPKLAAPLLDIPEEIEAFVEQAPAVEEALAPAPAPSKAKQKAPAAREAKRAVVRVPAEESVQMDVLVCLEDGKKTRDLARHLYENHSMTADEYREKWHLPASYPMVPPGLILKKGELFEFDPITKGLNPVNR